MNLFVVWKMNTHYLRLYILGHESFCCVEDEYTYYLRYISYRNLFVVWKMNTHYLFIYPFCCVEDEYTYYLRLYILGS